MSESSHTHSRDATGPLPIEPTPTFLVSLRNLAGIVGVLSLALLAVTALFPPERANVTRSMLFGFHFWLAPTLGGMAFVMISHMTGGGWGVIYRRFGEAAFVNLLWMFPVCMVMVVFGHKLLFPWAHIADFRLHDPEAYETMHKRLPWYSWNWFLVRQLVCFAIWGALAYGLRTGSLQLDHADNPVLRRRLRKISAAGVVLFFVTVTSYAMDYILSRETNWYSSIIGFISAIEFGLSGVSICTLTICYFAKRRPLRDVLTPQHLNDLGNLLLALVILWMYTSFSQFLIQWNGNLKEDVGYYVHRGLGQQPNGWRFVALTLFLGHFLLPFFLLLMKGLKRKVETLGAICVWIFIMRIVEGLWVIAPSNLHRTSDPGLVFWTDIFAFLGVGGVWAFLYLRTLGTAPLLPQNATHQPELISHGTHANAVHAV